MPDVLIETRAGWLASNKAAVIEAVHAAMVAALQIPQHDRVLRLIEHVPENFAIPPGLSERFTRIEITLFAGRSLDAKRKLYREIVNRLEPFGVPPTAVKIALIEVPLENWGIRGGHAASDIDLGFSVKV